MPVTHISSFSGGTNFATTHSETGVACGSGANRVAYVLLGRANQNTSLPVSCTVGTDTLTARGTGTFTDGSGRHWRLFTGALTVTGAQTVTGNWDTDFGFALMVGVVLTVPDAANHFANLVTGASGSTTQSLTIAASGDGDGLLLAYAVDGVLTTPTAPTVAFPTQDGVNGTPAPIYWQAMTRPIASSGNFDIGGTSASSNDWRGAAIRVPAAADVTSPTLTSPTGTGGTLVCSGSVSTNEANGALWAVVTASATAPTGVQVEAGQDHTGAAALRVVSNQAVTATGVQTIASGAVTAGARFLHFMHKDAAGNRSAVASSASFTVTSGGTAPSISTQPANQSVTAPAAATFTVVATGTGTLTYQWQRNPLGAGAFADISGATSASYTTPATTVTGGSANNTDTYRCVVTGDTAPAATSNAATLTVSAAGTAPNITVQPSNQTVTAPATATFSVTASGSGTLTYQWQRNGSNISGATSSSYTTPATTVTGGTANNGDAYRCVVTGDTAPAATSNSATLTVNASGTFSAVTDIIAVAGVALASTAVFWTWFPSGRAGTIGTVVNGTGTTNGIGALTVSHSVAGDGLLLVSTRPGPAVANDRLFAQFLTLA